MTRVAIACSAALALVGCAPMHGIISLTLDPPNACPGATVTAELQPLPGTPNWLGQLPAVTTDFYMRNATQDGPRTLVYHGTNRGPFTFVVDPTAKPGDDLQLEFDLAVENGSHTRGNRMFQVACPQ